MDRTRAMEIVIEAAKCWQSELDRPGGRIADNGELRAALAVLDAPGPDGVPEFVYMNFEDRGLGELVAVFSDRTSPRAESAYRFRFDSLVTPDDAGGKE